MRKNQRLLICLLLLLCLMVGAIVYFAITGGGDAGLGRPVSELVDHSVEPPSQVPPLSDVTAERPAPEIVAELLAETAEEEPTPSPDVPASSSETRTLTIRATLGARGRPDVPAAGLGMTLVLANAPAGAASELVVQADGEGFAQVQVPVGGKGYLHAAPQFAGEAPFWDSLDVLNAKFWSDFPVIGVRVVNGDTGEPVPGTKVSVLAAAPGVSESGYVLYRTRRGRADWGARPARSDGFPVIRLAPVGGMRGGPSITNSRGEVWIEAGCYVGEQPLDIARIVLNDFQHTVDVSPGHGNEIEVRLPGIAFVARTCTVVPEHDGETREGRSFSTNLSTYSDAGTAVYYWGSKRWEVGQGNQFIVTWKGPPEVAVTCIRTLADGTHWISQSFNLLDGKTVTVVMERCQKVRVAAGFPEALRPIAREMLWLRAVKQGTGAIQYGVLKEAGEAELLLSPGAWSVHAAFFASLTFDGEFRAATETTTVRVGGAAENEEKAVATLAPLRDALDTLTQAQGNKE